MPTQLPVDTLLINGQILTMDAPMSVHQAIAIRGNRIHAVGDRETLQRAAQADTRVIDLQGRTVIPGIIDVHAHLDREGLKNLQPGLEGVRSIADILDRIKREVSKTPPGEWVLTFLDHHIPFGLGTDNKPYNPFHTLWAAVARRERRSGAVIGPDQCLSRIQALHAFTMGGAVFCGVEAQRGSLAAGKLADLVVLSDDPLHMPEARLPELHAHLTFVGGRVVYDAADEDIA